MSTPAELLAQSLAKLRTAKRVSGTSASYKKDNPTEYAKVIAYLDGGARPSGVTTDMGMALLLEEDARRALAVVEPPPPPPPPPPSGILGVDRATMLATGGTILREDTSAVANPEPGLWGTIEAVSDARHVHKTTGGSTHLRANGSAQGNAAYRELTVVDGDDFYGERCELGRNSYSNGENTGAATNGTFALYKEGERRITFFSMRFGAGFTASLSGWQTVMQMKQTQTYGANGPVNAAPALELQVNGGDLHLDSFWDVIWTTTPPANNVWFRVALDVTYSQDPAIGKVQIFVDNDGDGDFLDAAEMSPVILTRTLAYVTSQGGGSIPISASIPSHLRLGIYHAKDTYGTTTVDVDNVQVVS